MVRSISSRGFGIAGIADLAGLHGRDLTQRATPEPSTKARPAESDGVPAGHRDAPHLPRRLVAAHHLGAEQVFLELLGRKPARHVARAGLRPLPPVILDADMEDADRRRDEQRRDRRQHQHERQAAAARRRRAPPGPPRWRPCAASAAGSRGRTAAGPRRTGSNRRRPATRRCPARRAGRAGWAKAGVGTGLRISPRASLRKDSERRRSRRPARSGTTR